MSRILCMADWLSCWGPLRTNHICNHNRQRDRSQRIRHYGVTVEAVHLGSNYRYTTKSNEAGIYTIGQLREGVYNLRAAIPGFKEAVIQNIQLVSLDVRLEIGAVETKVEVAASATVIETETASISDSKGANLMKSLPLNTRSLSSFFARSPGVLQAGAGSSTMP